jgi:hypothetical protein
VLTASFLAAVLSLLLAATLWVWLRTRLALHAMRARLAVHQIAVLGRDDEAREAAALRAECARLRERLRRGSGLRL